MVPTVDMTATSDHQAAFDHVTAYYYRDPDVARTTLALRHMLGMLASSPPEQIERFAPLVYLFGRIAQESAAAHAALAIEIAGYDGPDGALAQRIISARGDAAFPDALALPAVDPVGLDLLWAEFFVTGRPEPVVRIVGMLDREDRVRKHLERWLSERALFGGGRRRAYAEALRVLGIDLDVAARAIRTEGDLDCVCWAIAERKQPIFAHLTLAPDELTSVAIKASALWSLRLNATAHPVVGEVCRNEAERRGGPARLLLREHPATTGRPFAL